ncbi:hypothetical protein L3Q82_013734 [Scortum barcoo]|uniref:Uncharacterized protein n=1 Tax=Scortum barcoo TaxID=214431 RepID=A0ACB8W1K3_9TELE|nr:hypothetical protein L3Q82_013734 [Scortum barcoo]
MIRKGKDCYRRKMEHQLQQNNISGIWKGLKTITGFKEPKSQPVGDQRLVPPVHCSSCAHSPISQPSDHSNPTHPAHILSCAPPPSSPLLQLVLPHNTPALGEVCIVPVPKIPHPKKLISYRLVTLTYLMKTLERLVLVHLCPLVSSFMDPLQFAHQPGIGVDDAVISPSHLPHSLREGLKHC